MRRFIAVYLSLGVALVLYLLPVKAKTGVREYGLVYFVFSAVMAALLWPVTLYFQRKRLLWWRLSPGRR